MIKVDVSKENQQMVIEATGGVDEIMTDLMVVINGLYTQFATNDPTTGAVFRKVLTGMVNDPNSQLWTPLSGQTGIVFRKP